MDVLLRYFQQFGRFQKNARLYLISGALSYVTVGIITVLYNLYLVALGYNTAFIGFLLFIGTIGGGIAIFPAGICIDRFGGKAILIWASVLIGLAGTGQMLFRTPIPLLVSTFVVGIGGAFILVVNVPFMAMNSTPEERPHLFSLNIVLALIATVLGELLGGVLPLWLQATSWLMLPLPAWCNWLLASQPLARSYQLSLLVAGIIAAPSFIPLFMMDDDRPLQNRQNRTMHLKSQVTILSQIAMLFFSLRHASSARNLLRNPLIILTLVYTLIGLGAGLFMPYLNVYFVKHLGASTALFGGIDATANTLNALLTLLAPWFVTRFGILMTLLVPRFMSIPFMLVIGLTPFLPLAAFLYPLRQGLMDMNAGILQVFSMEEVSQQHRGLANSSYQAAYQVAWAVSASLGGLIISRAGYAPVFILAAALYVVALFLLWLCFKGHRRSPHIDKEHENATCNDQEIVQPSAD
jgi:MFS family permease